MSDLVKQDSVRAARVVSVVLIGRRDEFQREVAVQLDVSTLAFPESD